MDEPDDSLVLVLYLWSLQHEMPRGIATLFLDGILVYHRLPPVFVTLPVQLVSTISTPWRGEVLGELSVSCPRTRYGNSDSGSLMDLLIQSPTDLPLGH